MPADVFAADWIGGVSYLACAIAYLALAAVLVLSPGGSNRKHLFAVACFITSAWASVAFLSDATVVAWALPAERFFELSRGLGWLLFLATFGQDRLSEMVSRRGGWLALLVLLLAVGGPFVLSALAPGLAFSANGLEKAGLIAIAVGGLVLIEGLFRRADTKERWTIKFLGIGLGGVFAYDIFYYADLLLFARINEPLREARGAIHLLILPLLYLSAKRSKMWRVKLALSQKGAVYSTTLIGSGLYLLLMALVAYYIRRVGGSWGPIVQAVFLFGAAVLLTTVLTSGAYRAYVKVLVAKHFYEYKYDYRVEWRRFTKVISEASGTLSLPERVIDGIAEIVESPGGALWLKQPARFALTAARQMMARSLSSDEAEPIARFLAKKDWIIDLDEAMRDGERYEGLVVPRTLADIRGAWIIVPLTLRSDLIGFVLLSRPRAPRSLDWEDYDLLRMAGRQAASYIAEQSTARELAEARQFERFSRRVSFALHDIKNIVSQLSLVSSNLARHGDNPEFRQDALAVIEESVARMIRLTDQIRSEAQANAENDAIDLLAIVRKLAALKKRVVVDVAGDGETDRMLVAADPDRLSAILDHLVQNAVEAVGETGEVQIDINQESGSAIVEVTDNGPGMDSAFIRNELFTPFRSTKGHGFGLGAFQCREYARELGGDLEVISSPGFGTTMRVTLPLARDAVTRASTPTLSVVRS